MKMTGAEAVIKALEEEKVTVIFGYPGAANAPIYEALSKSHIKHILTRHEQGAAHAASGYARVTKKVGVCMATSGPGATNLITGIATAYMDSIPIVAITGQVSSEMIGRDVFQEVDITGATAPFCKHSYLVKNEKDLPRILSEAFHIAATGRPGPVLIDVPIDVQIRELDFKYPKNPDIRGYKPTYKGNGLQLKKIAEAIEKSEHPVICAGGGIIHSGASEELITIVEELGIPVVTTLMGIGAIPSSHPLNLGMLGSHGVYAANQAVSNSDLLIVMGARAGDRAIGKTDKFARHAQVIHIDIDPAEIGKNLGTKIPIVGDVKLILQHLMKYLHSGYKQEWVNTVTQWKDSRMQKTVKEYEDSDYVNPKYVLKELSELTEGNAVVATEVGQNQIWAANHYKTVYPGTFLTSGGLGTMGYGLPAAIGAKVGTPDKTVFVIAGDGSFQMSMQELGTMKQWDIDVKIILFNNQRLGMVRELQKMHYKSNYFSVTLDKNPDFIKIAAAYDIPGEKVLLNSKVKAALENALKYEGAYILEFQVDPEESTL
ncbi:biosynthetic-type acetolactate synthase large subunit [Petroclostridium sp. X23]|uniref:biosynthetic-type acetolactate synthase large subunit n=1 Tax=Petroclostridium sp. X23 TaxID=3045146 RepID=UPI0024ACA106|nr:biosynthetic-type acetolactate synthase large subunit [Petroclostridium sp. X23]WHH57206.1 biosynthetic-type acetolactate synthase large subunit [Petroclostridium sp. X23]